MKLLSFCSLFISFEIGVIFSTTNSVRFFLNSEKFFPLNSLIEFCKLWLVKLEYIPNKFTASGLFAKSFHYLVMAVCLS